MVIPAETVKIGIIVTVLPVTHGNSETTEAVTAGTVDINHLNGSERILPHLNRQEVAIHLAI